MHVISTTWYIPFLFWNLEHFLCVYPVAFSLACTILSIYFPPTQGQPLEDRSWALLSSLTPVVSTGHIARHIAKLSFSQKNERTCHSEPLFQQQDAQVHELHILHIITHHFASCMLNVANSWAKLQKPCCFTSVLAVILCIVGAQ